MNTDGGAVRRVTSGNFNHSGTPVWSADGSKIYFSSNRNPDWERVRRNTIVYLVDVISGEILALTERFGPDQNLAISPDGNTIAYLGFKDNIQTYQISTIMLMNKDGSNKQKLDINLDRSINSVYWSPNGKGLYFQYADKGISKIGYTNLKGKFEVVVEGIGGNSIGRPYGGGSFTISNNGIIATNISSPYHPAELAVLKKGKAVTKITNLNADLFAQRTLGKVEDVWYASSVDGRQIQGWLIYPPNYDESKTYPLLVEIHGGPISHYGPHFTPEFQLFAANGYVVFYPNMRGSTSYGEEFGNLLYHNYPGEDYNDIMDGVDVLIEKGITSEDSLFVTRGSAGGIMTAWIIGKNNRFESAMVVKPVMNWISKTAI